MGNGKFLYAILEHPAQDKLPYTGLHQAPLELVRYRDLAAVASTIDVEQFAGADEARLMADLVCYQQVNAALLRQHVLIPLRFGCTASNTAHIPEILAKVYLHLRVILNRFRDRVELVVQALWNLSGLLQELGQEQPEANGPESAVAVGRRLFEEAHVASTSTDAVQSPGSYFSGVILTDGEHDFGAIGLDGERVYTVRHQDIAAVVSSHPATSIKPLRRNLAPFHQTLRHVGTQHTTIPVKFGQIAEDDAQVRRLLQAHYASLKAELQRLHAKGEIGLTVSRAVDNLSAYLVESDEELRRFRDWLQSRGSPPRQEKIELGGRVYDRLNARRQARSQLVLRSLRQTSAESRLDGPWPPFSFVTHLELAL